MLKFILEVNFLLDSTDQIKILEMTEQLSEMIIQSELVDDYYRAFRNVQENKAALDKIKKFSEMKERYEEVKRFGSHHPDYKRVLKETFELKRKMDLDPTVAEFKKAESELQKLLDEISFLLGRAVSEHIKVPTGNPFFDRTKSCGCRSGGRCGCA